MQGPNGDMVLNTKTETTTTSKRHHMIALTSGATTVRNDKTDAPGSQDEM